MTEEEMTTGDVTLADTDEGTETGSRRRFHARIGVAIPTGAARAIWDFSVSRSMSLIAVFAVLAVLLGAGVGWLQWQRNQQSSVSDARGSAAIAAETGVTAVLSYNYRSLNSDVSHGEAALTGQFRDEYAQLMARVVSAAAKQQQATTSADVVSSSVISATPATAKMLLFVDQSTTSNSFTGPKLDGSRVVVTLDKVGGKWLISAIQPI